MSTPPADLGDGLFDTPTPETPDPQGQAGPEWIRVNTTARCDACQKALAEAHGQGPRPAAARWRRRTAASDTWLCYPHARQQRATDPAGGPR